ncbi:MAG: ABC transporter permease [Lachnospiraceae bacterium]|nr:ABC transporter permease [Lachnospiraceae bacterium]
MNKESSRRGGPRAALARFLTNERWTQITVPIFCIILTLIVSAVVLLVLGKKPGTAFYSFLAGNGFLQKANYGSGSGMISDFFSFLNIMAPMLLAALAFIFGYRCGLFNIGISGQMLLSGYVATVFIGYSELPGAVARPLVLIVGIIVGGLAGAFIGFLKYRFNIHEVVSTIMVNYIISYVTAFRINLKYIDMISRSSKTISSAARLTFTKVQIAGCNCNIPLGIIIAILAAILVHFVFEKTVFGFELRAVGSNRNAALYTGVNVGKQMISAMMISGMLAGLAGVTYYLGYTNTIIPRELVSMGYDSIATALLGNNSPIGAIFSSVLITIFQNGASYMSSAVGVAKEIASVITGILLLFSACGGYFRRLAANYLRKLADEEEEAKKAAAAMAAEKGGEDK